MRNVDNRSGIEILDRADCLSRLAGDVIGRLAVVSGNAPVIFPINYALDGECIVFRTDPGTKLDRGPRAASCFEIDGFDRERRAGWSVIVAGRLERIPPEDTTTVQRLDGLSLELWAPGRRDNWMRLVPERITGRIVRAGDRSNASA